MAVDVEKQWQTATAVYPQRLKELVSQYPGADVLELGGGCHPSFGLDEMPPNVATYTVNDISEKELDFAPPGYRKACFDVTDDVSKFEGQYDVVFSRFLAEHVRNGRAMHRNVHAVLKPGGVAFHMIPTLFASPFVVNRLLPNGLSSRLLQVFHPKRKRKFPAYYSCCRGNTAGMRKTLEEIGYRKVDVRDFYGHIYYDRVPLLRRLEDALSSAAARNGWSWYSSYALVTAYK